MQIVAPLLPGAPDDHRRIALALRAGGPWTITQLRGVLVSLLARNPDQAQEVRRRFDRFFDLSLKEPLTEVDVERALAELRGLSGSGEAQVQPSIRRATALLLLRKSYSRA